MELANVGNPGRRIVALLGGPTGSGKTAVACAIAKSRGWEILSCDSGQARRGMAIGTAAPNETELRTVKHHLVGHLAPDEPDSVASFLDRVEAILATPGPDLLAVGGTGQYLQALREGLDAVPPPDAQLRKEIAERIASEGQAALWRELQDRCRTPLPADAEKNPVRLQRAWEKHIQTQRGLVGRARAALAAHAPCFALAIPRADLREHLLARLQAMLEAGWGAESMALEYPATAPCWRCIGYSELRADPDPVRPAEATLQRIFESTRQYAKRQETFLRHRLAPLWIDAGRPIAEIHADIALELDRLR